MKKTLEITASFTGKISTAAYENSSPFFALKEVLEFDDQYPRIEYTDELILNRQKQLHEMCYKQFKQVTDVLYSERIAKQLKDMRFYDGQNGIKYPSVTSILNVNENFFIPADELNQMACRGVIIHRQAEIFLSTGEYKSPKDIAEVSAEYLTVLNGSLGLDMEDVDFRGLFSEYPIKIVSLESTVLNHQYRYGGRVDIVGIVDSKNPGKWNKVEGVKMDEPMVLDLKTGSSIDKTKCFSQLSAYAMALEGVKQICVLHLNRENKCGYSAPIFTSNVERYFNLFLKARKDFEKVYAI